MSFPEGEKYQKLKDIIRDNGGMITKVSRHFGVDRKTIYNWINQSAELKLIIEQERENGVDFAEAALMKQISRGNVAAIFYYLNNKGKERGYGVQNYKLQIEKPSITKDDLLAQLKEKIDTDGVIDIEASNIEPSNNNMASAE